jgi:uncharacterized protein
VSGASGPPPAGSLRIAARDLDPERPGVEVIETHVSHLVFVGDLVHKRKRAVTFAFVDLSTPAKRERVCRREVELNRRFSPDVYLGVEEVVDDAGRLIDHAVRMRRMPAERRLATLVAAGQDVSECVLAVARSTARCHATMATDDRISAVATHGALRELWRGNLREMQDFVPSLLDGDRLAEIDEMATRYLDGRRALLDERIARGRIVDGHGDLLADDIFCLDDGPRILDCLEFDDRLRWGDVLYDVGFLAMDLERLGHPDLVRVFLDRYRELSAETHPRSLEHHYIAYRALVRAKVSCLKGECAEAVGYLAQCRRHLRAGRVRLVLVGGLPGTGKTTVANALGVAQGWSVLRSDEVRKQIAGLDTTDRAAAGYGRGLYAPATVEGTYRTLLARARTLLERGESVVLDASFSRPQWRAGAAAIAQDSSSDVVELRWELPAEEAARRLVARARDQSDASDADPAVGSAMAEEFAPWPTASRVCTAPALPDLLPEVLAAVGGDV